MPNTHDKLREYLCTAFLHMPDIHARLDDHSEKGIEEYHNKMSTLGQPADEIMILTAATVLKRRIIVHPIFRTPYPFIQYNPENVRPSKDDFYLLHYSDKFFTQNIYKSIVPAKKRLSLPTDEDPKSSTLNGSTNTDNNQILLEESVINSTDNNKKENFNENLNNDNSKKDSPDSSSPETRRKKRRQRRRQLLAQAQKKVDLSN